MSRKVDPPDTNPSHSSVGEGYARSRGEGLEETEVGSADAGGQNSSVVTRLGKNKTKLGMFHTGEA